MCGLWKALATTRALPVERRRRRRRFTSSTLYGTLYGAAPRADEHLVLVVQSSNCDPSTAEQPSFKKSDRDVCGGIEDVNSSENLVGELFSRLGF